LSMIPALNEHLKRTLHIANLMLAFYRFIHSERVSKILKLRFQFRKCF